MSGFPFNDIFSRHSKALKDDCFGERMYVWIYENGAKKLKSCFKRAFFSRQKLSPKGDDLKII